MANRSTDNASMLAKAEDAFQREDYASTYKYCSELMKGKTASVVVYMQCVASLKLRENTKEFVDALIDDTLLLTVALDNFYVQSGMQNQNIVTYVRETLFTLLTSLIVNTQKNYPFKSPKRSFKNAFTGAQASITNMRKLKSYDFSKFHINLPGKLAGFAQETAEKLIAHVTNSINISKDVTNNWLYEDETDDLFERILNYKAALTAPVTSSGSEESAQPIRMNKNEISEYIEDISSDDRSEFKLEELDDINISPPADVKVNENYTGESQRVTVSQVLGKNNEEKSPAESAAKTNTLNLTGSTQLQRNKDTKKQIETQASPEAMNTIKEEFGGFSVKKSKTKDVFVMPEALDDFSGQDRSIRPTKGKNSKKQPIDLLIGVFVILFIIAVAYIIIYFLLN